MNKDSIFGKVKEIVGTMEESLGKAIHSDKLAAGGQHVQEAGRAQGAVGTATVTGKDGASKEEMKK